MSTGPLRMIRAENPSAMTLDGTRTFIVGRAAPVLIDPGPADARHVAALLRALEGAVPPAILLTHLHPDHAGAAPELSRRTGAQVGLAAPRELAERLGIERILPLQDDQRIDTDVGTIRVLATPGHTPDHLAFLWTGPEAPAGGAAFVGDLLMGSGDTTLVAPPEGDLRLYLDSLDRLEREGPGRIYPAHGPPLGDPTDSLRRFRAHRHQRIDQVRAALREGIPPRPERLATRVYGPDLPEGLRQAALGSLRAILLYLGEDAD